MSRRIRVRDAAALLPAADTDVQPAPPSPEPDIEVCRLILAMWAAAFGTPGLCCTGRCAVGPPSMCDRRAGALGAAGRCCKGWHWACVGWAASAGGCTPWACCSADPCRRILARCAAAFGTPGLCDGVGPGSRNGDAGIDGALPAAEEVPADATEEVPADAAGTPCPRALSCPSPEVQYLHLSKERISFAASESAAEGVGSAHGGARVGTRAVGMAPAADGGHNTPGGAWHSLERHPASRAPSTATPPDDGRRQPSRGCGEVSCIHVDGLAPRASAPQGDSSRPLLPTLTPATRRSSSLTRSSTVTYVTRSSRGSTCASGSPTTGRGSAPGGCEACASCCEGARPPAAA